MIVSELEDSSLFNKVKSGDLNSFEILFHRYYNQLANYCSKLVRDPVIAEEITQEIFIYLWEKKQAIEINTSLKSYLFSAIRNKSINYIKYELPKQQMQVDINESNLIFESKTQFTHETDQLREKIKLAIDDLPLKCKEIFILSRYAGLTYQEIADEMDLSIKTVENQISIALKKLREKLASDIKNQLDNE